MCRSNSKINHSAMILLISWAPTSAENYLKSGFLGSDWKKTPKKHSFNFLYNEVFWKNRQTYYSLLHKSFRQWLSDSDHLVLCERILRRYSVCLFACIKTAQTLKRVRVVAVWLILTSFP